MESNLAQQKIKSALKEYLRQQNYTYSDVAEVWKCSIPTVKRQLGAEELPLSRLLELLDWLNLSLAQLEKMAETEGHELPRWTQKQNEFLAKNPRELGFLMKLYEGVTPAQIAKKYQMQPSAVDKILLNLEKYDLIRVGSGGRVKPAHERLPRFDGALGKATLHQQIDQMARFQKHRMTQFLALRDRGIQTSKGGMSWSVKETSEETYNRFHEKFSQLFEEFDAVIKLEKHTRKPGELKKAVVHYSMILNELDEPSLDWVENLFANVLKADPKETPDLPVSSNKN